MPQPTLEHSLLVTEELGFSYEKHITDYVSIINKLVYECSNVFKNHMIKSMAVDEDLITEAVYNLEEKLEKSIDLAISDHEAYCVRNIFNLPENTDSRLFRLSSQLNYKFISETKYADLRSKVHEEVTLVEINIQKIAKLKELVNEITKLNGRLDKLITAYGKLAALQAAGNGNKETERDFSWLLPTLNNAREKTLLLQRSVLSIVKKESNPYFVEQFNNVI